MSRELKFHFMYSDCVRALTLPLSILSSLAHVIIQKQLAKAMHIKCYPGCMYSVHHTCGVCVCVEDTPRKDWFTVGEGKGERSDKENLCQRNEVRPELKCSP